jgi:hypothetical protein
MRSKRLSQDTQTRLSHSRSHREAKARGAAEELEQRSQAGPPTALSRSCPQRHEAIWADSLYKEKPGKHLDPEATEAQIENGEYLAECAGTRPTRSQQRCPLSCPELPQCTRKPWSGLGSSSDTP